MLCAPVNDLLKNIPRDVQERDRLVALSEIYRVQVIKREPIEAQILR